MSKGDDEQTRKLDLLSADFDALQCLTAPRHRIQLPDPNAPIYDNMTWFVETESGIFPRERATKNLASENATASTSTSTAGTSRGRGRIGWKMSSGVPPSASSESGVDPLSSSQSSESVKDSVSQTRVRKNVLTKMDTAVGPLAFLKKCMDERLRAKVIVRGAASIRGFCIGFVEAFDKHMNLVLKDVFETWKRPRKKNQKPISIEAKTDAAEKRENVDDDEEEENVATAASTSGSALLHKYRPKNTTPKEPGSNENACYPIARWVVKRRTKKKDICERHVHQLLIRGEQVVCVMLDR